MQGFAEQLGAFLMLRDRNEDRHHDFGLLAKNRRRECFTIALSSRWSFGPRIDEMCKGESHTVLGGKLSGVSAGTQYPRLRRLLCERSKIGRASCRESEQGGEEDGLVTRRNRRLSDVKK